MSGDKNALRVENLNTPDHEAGQVAGFIVVDLWAIPVLVATEAARVVGGEKEKTA